MLFAHEVIFLRGQAVQAIEVRGNTAVEALRNALALAALKKKALIARIADEGNFREHSRHIRAGQNEEGRALHAAVSFAPVYELQSLCERLLNVAGKLFGLLDLLVARDLLNQIRKV